MENSKTYQNGEEIKIKPQWQDGGEDDIKITVVEDRGDRVLIRFHLPNFRLLPTQTIDKHMIVGEPDESDDPQE